MAYTLVSSMRPSSYHLCDHPRIIYATILVSFMRELTPHAHLTVLLQLPATYARTYELYGYAGTVAGFTCAILLLDSSPGVPKAMQRYDIFSVSKYPSSRTVLIISVYRMLDTYVGVVVYLLGQIIAGSSFSEDELLNIVSSSVTCVQKNFSSFISEFRLDQSGAGSFL